MIDLNQVALFVEVVAAGSFAEAARRLNMPANTVSRQIQQLEDQLGLRLMQRSTRKLTLTDAGVAFHDESALQIEQLLAATERAGRGSHKPHGTIHVAATADFLEYFSAVWIAEFLQAHPEVKLDLVLSDARADLIGGGIDVAFRGGELDDSTLVARKLASFDTVLVASPTYLAQRGTPATVSELASHDCVKSSKPGTRTTWRFLGPQGPVEIAITGRFSATTAQSQMRAVAAGLGVGMLPAVIAYRELQAGNLVEVLPSFPQPAIDVYAVYSSRRLLAPAVSAFIEFVEKKLKDEVLPLLKTHQGRIPPRPHRASPKARATASGPS